MCFVDISRSSSMRCLWVLDIASKPFINVCMYIVYFQNPPIWTWMLQLNVNLQICGQMDCKRTLHDALFVLNCLYLVLAEKGNEPPTSLAKALPDLLWMSMSFQLIIIVFMVIIRLYFPYMLERVILENRRGKGYLKPSTCWDLWSNPSFSLWFQRIGQEGFIIWIPLRY